MKARNHEDIKDCLTPRQYEVLGLVARRFSSKEIGRELGLSHKTVDHHVKEIVSKLGAASRADAGRIFLEAPMDRERLPREAQPLDDPTPLGPPMDQPEGNEPFQAGENQHLSYFNRFIKLPPAGGARHDMTNIERLASIGRAALVSLIVLSAIMALISGIHTRLGD